MVEAIAEDDADRLERLLVPIAANGRIPYVEVLRPDGSQLLALRLPDLGADAGRRLDPEASRWSPLASVLRGAADDQVGEAVAIPVRDSNAAMNHAGRGGTAGPATRAAVTNKPARWGFVW